MYFFLLIEEAPIKAPINKHGGTMLMLKYSSPVQVLKEEEAFSFGSLVADCGGVLGLFIGFNFLMVWDWIVWATEQLRYLLVARPKK